MALNNSLSRKILYSIYAWLWLILAIPLLVVNTSLLLQLIDSIIIAKGATLSIIAGLLYFFIVACAAIKHRKVYRLLMNEKVNSGGICIDWRNIIINNYNILLVLILDAGVMSFSAIFLVYVPIISKWYMSAVVEK